MDSRAAAPYGVRLAKRGGVMRQLASVSRFVASRTGGPIEGGVRSYARSERLQPQPASFETRAVPAPQDEVDY